MPTDLATAKLNLGLQVLRRRTDGFHDLSTIFYPIGWADTLKAEPADHLQMTCTEATLSADESNLVMRAAGRLAQAFGVRSGALLHLEKVLPVGAGLGGGSSDAAAALRVLCDLWALSCTRRRLHQLALELGSDVPFFLYGRAAHASGRGEDLRPMSDYSMPFALVVAAPPIHVSTAWAFGQIRPSASERADLEAVVRSNDLDRWRRELINDFEHPVMSVWPLLKTIKRLLLEAGAGFASMTGSGSAMYGVFESESDAAAACGAARQAGCRTWIERPSGG